MAQRIRYLTHSFLQILTALMVLMSCRAQDTAHQDTVARIADKYVILFPELQQYAKDQLYVYKYRRRLETGFQVALHDMIVNRWKIIDFFALGLDNDAELLRRNSRTINEELVVQFYRTQFHQKYLNEDSVRQAYKEMRREVVYQQIVLVIPKGISPKGLDSLKLLANTIKVKAQKGVGLAALAKRYSLVVESSRPSGPLPHMTWQLSLMNNLNNAVFHLALNEVRVIDSGPSIHIVKAVKINSIDVRPYAEVKEEIRKILDRQYSNISYDEFEAAKMKLIDEKTLQWSRRALEQLVQWSNIPRFYQTVYSDTLRSAIARGDNFVILKYSKGTVDFREYLHLLNNILIWPRIDSIGEDDIKAYVLEAVRTEKIVEQALALHLMKDIYNPATVDPVRRAEIVRLYDQREIEEQIPAATENALVDFYRANKDSLYYQLPKVNLYAVVDSSKNAINGLKEKLAQHIPFEKLAPEILVKTYIRKRDGTNHTYLVDNEPPFFADVAFKMKLHEIVGPVEYVDPVKGRQFALLKCVAIRGVKQLSYEDVKGTIADDFVKYYRKKIARSVEERLREKYGVTIYKDVLQQRFSAMGIGPQ
jgi:hypothetical protein